MFFLVVAGHTSLWIHPYCGEHLEKEKKSKQPINVSQNTRHCQQVIGGPPGHGAGWYQHTIASLQLVNYFSGTHAVAMPLSSAKTEI